MTLIGKPKEEKVLEAVGEYLTILTMVGNYKERQRIKLTNQQLPVYLETLRKTVMGRVARGILVDRFLEEWEQSHPTHGRPLPEQFAAYCAKALEG